MHKVSFMFCSVQFCYFWTDKSRTLKKSFLKNKFCYKLLHLPLKKALMFANMSDIDYFSICSEFHLVIAAGVSTYKRLIIGTGS